MARVKRGVTAKSRHKKVLKEAKGYYGARSNCSKQPNKPSSRQASTRIATAVSANANSGVYG